MGFLFEWLARHGAFRRKLDGLKDVWFCFDSFLVGLMVLETFVLPYVFPAPEEKVKATSYNSTLAGDPSGGANLAQLSMLRMLRLLRLTRMVRLMRSVPELVTLLRSMTIALRSVLSTLTLLVIFMYIFAIIFKSQLKVDPTDKNYSYMINKFGRVPDAMWTLLLAGTFLDDITPVANRLLESSAILTVLFVLFVLLSSFTILNMLVGLLCDVVSAVAAAEKEKVMVSCITSKLLGVLDSIDTDGNGTISKAEFTEIMQIPEAVQALTELGVDVQNLMSLSDHLFEVDDDAQRQVKKEEEEPEAEDEPELPYSEQHGAFLHQASERPACAQDGQERSGVTLSKADFLEMVIRLRSTNQPSVIDIVDLRKLILRSQKNVMHRLEQLEEANSRLAADMHAIMRTIDSLSSQDFMKGHHPVQTISSLPKTKQHGSGNHQLPAVPQVALLGISHEEGFEGNWDIANEGDSRRAAWEGNAQQQLASNEHFLGDPSHLLHQPPLSPLLSSVGLTPGKACFSKDSDEGSVASSGFSGEDSGRSKLRPDGMQKLQL